MRDRGGRDAARRASRCRRQGGTSSNDHSSSRVRCRRARGAGRRVRCSCRDGPGRGAAGGQGGVLIGHRGAMGRGHPRRARGEAAAGRITYTFTGRHRLRRRHGARPARRSPRASSPTSSSATAFGNEEAVRRVAADYPDIAFVFGSGGGPAEPNFSVFDNWIHEPAYLAGHAGRRPDQVRRHRRRRRATPCPR